MQGRSNFARQPTKTNENEATGSRLCAIAGLWRECGVEARTEGMAMGNFGLIGRESRSYLHSGAV